MKKLGVLIVHGMGSQDSEFANGMIEELEGRLADLQVEPAEVEWEPVWWAPVLTDAENRLLRDAKRDNDLDYTRLREFVIHSLADAIAYRRVPDGEGGAADIDTYADVHKRIRSSVQDLRDRMRQGASPDSREAPLFVIAHSLGAHMISNYIWDLQEGREPSRGNAFEDMQTVAGLCTFGCNIPLFTLAHRHPKPIEFPTKSVRRAFPSSTSREAIDRAVRWVNYYDPDDILGWPLKPLSNDYAKTVDADVAINTGGLFSSWNPMSHSQYWEDNDLTKPLARQLAEVLRLL